MFVIRLRTCLTFPGGSSRCDVERGRFDRTLRGGYFRGALGLFYALVVDIIRPNFVPCKLWMDLPHGCAVLLLLLIPIYEVYNKRGMPYYWVFYQSLYCSRFIIFSRFFLSPSLCLLMKERSWQMGRSRNQIVGYQIAG